MGPLMHITIKTNQPRGTEFPDVPNRLYSVLTITVIRLMSTLTTRKALNTVLFQIWAAPPHFGAEREL